MQPISPSQLGCYIGKGLLVIVIASHIATFLHTNTRKQLILRKIHITESRYNLLLAYSIILKKTLNKKGGFGLGFGFFLQIQNMTEA